MTATEVNALNLCYVALKIRCDTVTATEVNALLAILCCSALKIRCDTATATEVNALLTSVLLL